MSNTVQFRRSTAVLTLIAASIGGGLIAAFAVMTRTHAPVYVTARADTQGQATQRVTQLSDSFADIIEKASPAVVEITSTRIIKASAQDQGNNPFQADPFFRQFFGPFSRPRDQRERGLGSGVIVTNSGYILTNNHVIEKATSLKVKLSDGRELTGKVVGADPQTDVAVVKIDAESLPAMPFANSDSARVGDLCFAIGNPFGEEHTVTMGIVSAKNRNLREGPTRIQNFIQTDAAINPGNSGGALINARGQLIGMNTMILTGGSSFGEEGGNIGIGFAVPSNLAKSVMDQIMKTGKVSRGYMGVTLQQLTPELAQQFGVKNAQGALVGDVTSGAPGDKAGLKSGDVITAIDGKQVQGADDLTLDVISHAPGSKVTLDVVRNGKPMQVQVTLGQRPGGVDWNKSNAQQDNGDEEDNGNTGNASVRGITVQTLTSDMVQQLGIPDSVRGVVVESVDPDSPAADVVGRGVVITAVNREPVRNAQDFRRLMSQAKGNVLLTINTGGQSGFVVVPGK